MTDTNEPNPEGIDPLSPVDFKIGVTDKLSKISQDVMSAKIGYLKALRDWSIDAIESIEKNRRHTLPINMFHTVQFIGECTDFCRTADLLSGRAVPAPDEAITPTAMAARIAKLLDYTKTWPDLSIGNPSFFDILKDDNFIKELKDKQQALSQPVVGKHTGNLNKAGLLSKLWNDDSSRSL